MSLTTWRLNKLLEVIVSYLSANALNKVFPRCEWSLSVEHLSRITVIRVVTILPLRGEAINASRRLRIRTRLAAGRAQQSRIARCL